MNVLLLGLQPVAAAQALRALGATVTLAVDSTSTAPAQQQDVKRVVVVEDPTNASDVLAALYREGLELRTFDAVCAAGEFEVGAAALLNSLADGSWLPVDVAIAVRDKVVQKRRVRAAGLPTAAVEVVDVLHRGVDLPLPCVIKPLAGAGSRRTTLLRNALEVQRLLDKQPDLNGSGPWAVEEHVVGDELHLDGFVRDGALGFVSVSRYTDNVLAVQEGRPVVSVVLREAAHPDLYRSGREFATRALSALGHRDGVFHLEVFLVGNCLVFGECAARVGGGRIGDVVLRQFGIDLHEQWARAVLGLPSTVSPATALGCTHGWVILQAPAGVVHDCPSADDLMSLPGVVWASVDLLPGHPAPNTRIGSDVRAGRVVVAADDETATARLLAAAQDAFLAGCTST